MSNQNLVAELVNEMQQPNYAPQQFQQQQPFPQQFQQPQPQMAHQQLPPPPLQAPPPVQQQVEDYEEEVEYTTREPIRFDRFGMDDEPKSFTDRLFEGLKEPVLVGLLFLLISLPQTDALISNFLPSIAQNPYYFYGLKAVLLGVLFAVVRYLLA